MNTYANPVIPGFNPDPSIIRVKEDYFLVTSSFEYFPGAPIYHSTDLIQWKLIGHALNRTSQIQIHSPEPGGGVWATTIRHHNGAFYVTAANFSRYRPLQDDRVLPRGFYVCTQNIWDENSWSDPVYFDQVGFDQDLFWDDDGAVYLSTTRPKLNRTQNSPSGISEGSHIFKRVRYYYLLTAEGGTGSAHNECVFRSEKGPFGPWEAAPHNPVCRNGINDEVQNTGHADLVSDSQGQWWAVLLGVRPVWNKNRWETSVFGRETFLIPVEWVDDWPIFNRGHKVSLLCTGPGVYHYEASISWRDDFSTPKLQLGWYRKNTPLKVDYSLTVRSNLLRLYGGPYNLSVPASPTLLLRKQTHRFCRWETRLSFHPSSTIAEAGTVVWWNYFTYASIGIRTNGENRFVRFRDTMGRFTERKLKGYNSDVVLCIVCGDAYLLGFREVGDESEKFQWFDEVSNAAMTADPPIGLSFTGMMLGLYSFAEGQPSSSPADFHYVEVN
ncbi:glycosyl hydrolase [Talaromyces proteolyticus]|uniref:Glycosyl hydrolase n=1 Tax=Talaromyces proteolyticus TaxID=1131652 RepID=A0AAD4KR10_9EURO|nr:glycosyl hydrolase [Talaromyces proteolyticus]KAH8694154.1 glycosyl hydrolase [Talaromyces proteolyticus]